MKTIFAILGEADHPDLGIVSGPDRAVASIQAASASAQPESESESEPESGSIRSPESESETEQPHHDPAPLLGILLSSR